MQGQPLTFVSPHQPPRASWVLFPEQAHAVAEREIGGKARGLARLTAMGAPVPAWFVVSNQAFQRHLGAALGEPNAPLSERSPETLRLLMESCPIDQDLVEEVARAAERLGPGVFAVRSSMSGEDSALHSFAGQLSTFLAEPVSSLCEAIRQCWASAFIERVLTYKRLKGLSMLPLEMGVVVQKLVHADVAGVAVTRATNVQLSSCWGLGEPLVSGQCGADEWLCSQDGRVLHERIALKRERRVPCSMGRGLATVPVSLEQQSRPCLSAEQISQLVQNVQGIARVLGGAQDIEWAWEGKKLWILQARPVTAQPLVQGDVPTTTWDSSNIGETYCGTTTPLTFSLARMYHRLSYLDACRMCRVFAPCHEQEQVTQHLLGFLNGRIYYNLKHWYRMLAWLPSYARNRRAFDQMMGVEPGPDLLEKLRPGLWKRARLAFSAALLAWRFWRSDNMVRCWLKAFHLNLATFDRAALKQAPLATLVEELGRLKTMFLEGWGVPILNDLFVMLSMGQLQRSVAGVMKDKTEGTLARLLGGEDSIESLLPARLLSQLAQEVSANPEQRVLWSGENTPSLEVLRSQSPSVAARLDDYIEQYGDRVMDELKMESRSLREDPSFLLNLLRSYLEAPSLDTSSSQRNRKEAEEEVLLRLKRSQRPALLRQLKTARAALRHREILRLARTRLFGLYRDVFRAMGDRLREAGWLENASDIVYLTVEELIDFQSGCAATTDLASVVKDRREEYERNQKLNPPRRRTSGVLPYELPPFSELRATSSELRGIAASPGVVEGVLSVVQHLSEGIAARGRILATARTDPGWIALLPLVRGLLVEHGSSLSHAAILAREFGLPAVVGIPELLARVKHGERVRLDGNTGTVDRLGTVNETNLNEGTGHES